MKILLKEDVEKLGAVGDIVTVADGFARNYLIPNGLAVKATAGQIKQIDVIRLQAQQRRELLEAELAALTEKLSAIQLTFEAKASERGRLYGSITKDTIVEAIGAQLGEPLDRRKVETDPLRQVGLHTIPVRLSAELLPEVTVIVHREGEDPAIYLSRAEEEEIEEETAEGTQTEDENYEAGVDVESKPADLE